MVLGTSFEAPQGKVVINRTCNHANLWSRIGRANRDGQFDLIQQSQEAVVADPYLVAYGRSVQCR